jgi:hypothetical protein
VLSLRDRRISWIAGFLDPQVLRYFSVPMELSQGGPMNPATTVSLIGQCSAQL